MHMLCSYFEDIIFVSKYQQYLDTFISYCLISVLLPIFPRSKTCHNRHEYFLGED